MSVGRDNVDGSERRLYIFSNAHSGSENFCEQLFIFPLVSAFVCMFLHLCGAEEKSM